MARKNHFQGCFQYLFISSEANRNFFVYIQMWNQIYSTHKFSTNVQFVKLTKSEENLSQLALEAQDS